MDNRVNVDFNLEQAISFSEDLKSLVGSEYHQIADQITHHVRELKMIAHNDWLLNSGRYQTITKMFERDLRAKFKNYLLNNNTVKVVSTSFSHDSVRLSTWDKIMNSIDEIIQAIELFSFNSNLRIEIRDNSLFVEGELEKGIDLSIRPKAYLLTRFFLLNQTLVTFKINSANSNLRLDFDFSHDQNRIYSVDFNHGSLGFSDTFPRYLIDKESLVNLSQHICLTVESDSTLQKYNAIPEKYIQEYNSLESAMNIYYFPFLFMPISLIIPKGGKIVSSRDLLEKNHYFDFFSAINF